MISMQYPAGIYYLLFIIKCRCDQLLSQTNRMPTTIYKFTTMDDEVYVGRTHNLESRKVAHIERYGKDIRFEILGTYPTIVIAGFGRLDARMEHLWYKRLRPNLNKLICGNAYYKRDLTKHGDDVLKLYEELHNTYQVVKK